jgi:hypothetical protein
MCLTALDVVRQLHRVGIKIVKPVTDENGTLFKAALFDTVYEIGKWFDAGPPSRLHKEMVSGVPYPAGVHYFRSDKGLALNYQQVFLKVRVKKVLATGMQGLKPAGVARCVLPLKAYIPIEKPNRGLNDLAKVTGCTCLVEIYKRSNTKIPTMEQTKAVLGFMTKSKEHFAKAISFIDHFERQSAIFKFFTLIHTTIHKNPLYHEYYKQLMYRNREMLQFENLYRRKIEASGIPNIR